jgi:hypothetical protein
MKSSQQDEVRAALDAVEAGYARLRAACSDSVGNAFRVDVAEELERQHRVNRALMYRIVGELIEPPDGPDDPDLPAGTVISKLLWQRLRITTREVKRRMRVAVRIRPRRTLTGPQLPPELPQLAAAVEDGAVGDDHITAVCEAIDLLPSVAHHKKDICERILVRHAKEQDASFVTSIGKGIAEYLNPDTVFDEQDRRRRSGITLGPQHADGMSYLRGWIDPESRAYLESINAAAKPGRHQPDTDESGCDEHGPASGSTFRSECAPASEPAAAPETEAAPEAAAAPESEPDEATPDDHSAVQAESADDAAGPADSDGLYEVKPDARSAAQRLHDAFKMGLRAAISSGAYGQHRGLPVTVIATAPLAQLDQAAHALNNPAIPMPPPARTGGGSFIPMRDLIRMAANAIHYLAIFDDHSERPLYLGRTKRIATADQRIICYARDRGCTRPGCTEPGYHCEVNHDPPWAAGGKTDADCLHFGCGPDHAMLSKGLLHVKVTDAGRLAWSDGTGPPEVNLAHHPEDLLAELFEDDAGDFGDDERKNDDP